MVVVVVVVVDVVVIDVVVVVVVVVGSSVVGSSVVGSSVVVVVVVVVRSSVVGGSVGIVVFLVVVVVVVVVSGSSPQSYPGHGQPEGQLSIQGQSFNSSVYVSEQAIMQEAFPIQLAKHTSNLVLRASSHFLKSVFSSRSVHCVQIGWSHPSQPS